MKKSTWIWIAGIVVVLFVLFIGAIVFAVKIAFQASKGELFSGNIALLHITGVITSGTSEPTLFGGEGTGSETILKKLDIAAENPKIKAIVLRVDSPGGTAAGSQEIYEKLMKIRETTRKVIVVSMGDVAASGAYYISSAADKIYADPATLTGSIGVIAELMDLQGLYKKIGIIPEILKAGKFKDMGNAARPLTPAEKKLFQKILDEAHKQFIEDVAKGRKMSVATVQALADGRVYTGEQALKNHLVDALGNLEDAERGAAQLAGIKGSWHIVNLDRTTFWQELTQNTFSHAPLPQALWAIEQNLPRPGVFFLAPSLVGVR
jgi:protease-4